MTRVLHRIAHWFGWEYVELLGIVHEPTCPGFCFITAGMKQCDWKGRFKCKTCGEVFVR